MRASSMCGFAEVFCRRHKSGVTRIGPRTSQGRFIGGGANKAESIMVDFKYDVARDVG